MNHSMPLYKTYDPSILKSESARLLASNGGIIVLKRDGKVVRLQNGGR